MANRIMIVCAVLVWCALCAPPVSARGCEEIPLSSPDKIVFFGGNACHDDVVCRLAGTESERLDFSSSRYTDARRSFGSCTDNRARSVCLLPGLEVGTFIIVTDDPGGRDVGDHAHIHILGEITRRVCVSSFEWDSLIDGVVEIDATYDHGLDGKVSNVWVVP